MSTPAMEPFILEEWQGSQYPHRLRMDGDSIVLEEFHLYFDIGGAWTPCPFPDFHVPNFNAVAPQTEGAA